jgi:hypothetical protein
MDRKNSEVPKFQTSIFGQRSHQFVERMLNHRLGFNASDPATLRDSLGHITLGIHAFPFVVMR